MTMRFARGKKSSFPCLGCFVVWEFVIALAFESDDLRKHLSSGEIMYKSWDRLPSNLSVEYKTDPS